MICKNCGTEINEGIFCPECGTKNESGNMNEGINSEIGKTAGTSEEYKKAYSILTEYEQVEKEKQIISELGWPKPDALEERIKMRVEIYHKAKALDIQTVGAKQMIERMRNDINEDYYKYKKKDGSLGAQRFWAIVFTVLAVCVAFPFGIIGIIIGLIIIWAGWHAVSELKKTKKILIELENLLNQI